MRRHFTTLAFVALAACAGKDDSGTVLTDEPTVTIQPLEDGVYKGAILELESADCPHAFSFWGDTSTASGYGPSLLLSAGNPTVVNTGRNRFIVDVGDGIGPECEATATGVTCDGYSQEGGVSIDSEISEFVIESPTEFTMREAVEFDCSADVCADIDATFPCSVDLVEHFVLTVGEADFCFDLADNDGDDLVDHEDPDCPAFTPQAWSMDGEFGYDATAGGAVPYLLGGAVHPPTVNIRISAAEGTSFGAIVASRDLERQCVITLTSTATEPIPMTLVTDEFDAYYQTYYTFDLPLSVTHHTLALPPGEFVVTSDCPDKGFEESATYGTIEDIANAAWALGVGEEYWPSDTFGESRRFGIGDGLVAYGAGFGYAVDSGMNVLAYDGSQATDGDTLLDLDPATVSGALPLPSGVYVLQPWSAGTGYHLGD